MKSQVITKVIRIHLLGAVDICTNYIASVNLMMAQEEKWIASVS